MRLHWPVQERICLYITSGHLDGPTEASFQFEAEQSSIFVVFGPGPKLTIGLTVLLEQNAGQRHHLYFINVPAPVYDEKLTTDLNSEVARTVALFNTALKKYSQQHGFDTVDVFKFTAGKEGFSNGLFHIDSRHLGAKALPEIERQLS